MPKNAIDALWATGKSYVTMADVARALGLNYHAFSDRLRDLPVAQHPASHGGFRGGNAWCMSVSTAVEWVTYYIDKVETPKQREMRDANAAKL